jgi:hypothetical protein
MEQNPINDRAKRKAKSKIMTKTIIEFLGFCKDVFMDGR